MNDLAKMILWFLALNFAIGITLMLVPAFNTNPETTMGMQYDSTMMATFNNSIAGEVSADKVDSGGFFNRLIDIITLGYFTKFKNGIGAMLSMPTGIITLLENIFSGFFSPTISSFIFGGFRTIIWIMYSLMFIELITGRRLTDW
jgi:hypothetical protein